MPTASVDCSASSRGDRHSTGCVARYIRGESLSILDRKPGGHDPNCGCGLDSESFARTNRPTRIEKALDYGALLPD